MFIKRTTLVKYPCKFHQHLLCSLRGDIFKRNHEWTLLRELYENSSGEIKNEYENLMKEKKNKQTDDLFTLASFSLKWGD